MVKLIEIAGKIWLYLAGAVILFGYGSIWYFDGFAALQEILSPFNVINYLAVAVTLAPGVALLFWANRIKERQESEKTNSEPLE